MTNARSECPVANVLDIVGDRWTLLIIRDIAVFKKTSFSEMAASAEGIPPSTLTARLQMLVHEAFITKSELVGVPGRQYRYELSRKGQSLLPILEAMMHWDDRSGTEPGNLRVKP
jgi:DNA-binding HxlR family transcriptional regulator